MKLSMQLVKPLLVRRLATPTLHINLRPELFYEVHSGLSKTKIF